MTCDFTSFSTVVHLYQDDGWDVANERVCAVEHGTLFMVEKISSGARIELGIARSAGQGLTH